MLSLVTPSLAQETPHEATEAHGGEHGAFPPFDPATFGSQLLWLAIFFGLLYFLMSRVALPRIGAILAERDNRVAGDIAEAGRLKGETDAAIAAYEQALATARHNAHGIAHAAREEAKAKIAGERARIESGLRERLEEAERRIAEVKNRALAEVDAVAKEATETLVEVLLGPRVTPPEVAQAVQSALAERS